MEGSRKAMLIQVENVYKHYVQPKTTVEVLDGVELAIAAKEMVAIVGPSGAGPCFRGTVGSRAGESE